MTTPEDFRALLAPIIDQLRGRALDDALLATLEASFGEQSEAFRALSRACHEGTRAGWMCEHERGGIRYGRVIEASEASAGFSVDVVQMKDVKGPYHLHPKGEIDLVMPVTAGARFDGHGAGWVVYGPRSAHYPTVTEGEAFVLYLLPDGAIDFRAKPPE